METPNPDAERKLVPLPATGTMCDFHRTHNGQIRVCTFFGAAGRSVLEI
jgi:hypothetical protein